MFINIISIDLNKLFQDGSLATGAFDCESCGIVKMTIYLPSVLVIRVLRSEDCRANTTCKVLDVELHV